MSESTVIEIAESVRRGERKAVEVLDEYLGRIAAGNERLNAFVHVDADLAHAAAAAIDEAVARGDEPGPLAGVPFAVKNLFDLKGVVTMAGSKIDAERPAAAADATIVQRLIAAGAVPVGALNMDEYAYGFTTENSHYGGTCNPHDPSRVAGAHRVAQPRRWRLGLCHCRSARTLTVRSGCRLRCAASLG